MENILVINSPGNNLFFDNSFPVEITDYFCIDAFKTKEGAEKHTYTAKFLKDTSLNRLAEELASWLLLKYEDKIIKDVLKERFIDFSQDETDEIIENTRKSLRFFNKIYGEKLIVKKITNHLLTSKLLMLNGFLRFGLKEYRRAVEMFIFEAIEELQTKKEYFEFIELLKVYIDECSSLIDFIHVKTDSFGKFKFFDFKKSEIVIETSDRASIEIFSTREDLLLNLLISLAPKRILWHINPEFENSKIYNTLKEIFGERISVCNGCELCTE